jgi:FMN phosphatase YigB (HAD superfamily)
MALSLAEYADALEARSLIWPRVPPPIPVVATPAIKPLPGIRAVLWDIYGTLVRISEGRFTLLPQEEVRLQIALDKTIHEFNMWNHMYRKPGPPWQSMIGIYRSTIERLQMRASSRGDHTEVNLVDVWLALIEKLFEKNYVIDEDQYGDVEEFAEKVAFFFHCSLQGLEARSGVARAMSDVAGHGLLQGLLADGQPFTLIQLLREIAADGPLPPIHEIFRPTTLLLSTSFGVRKPSRSLYVRAVERLRDEGIQPDQILHVSCRLMTDLVPAKAVGMKTALLVAERSGLELSMDVLKAPETRPDRLLTSLSQISSIVSPS